MKHFSTAPNTIKVERTSKDSTSRNKDLVSRPQQELASDGTKDAAPSHNLPKLTLRPFTLAPVPTVSAGFTATPGPASNGPASSCATIPPRPKPGRKPASDEPENKRKAQNRAAQRAFRERKMHGQQQLETENKELKAVNEQLSQTLQQRRAETANLVDLRISRLEAELAKTKRREEEAREQLERNMDSLAVYGKKQRDAEARAEQERARADRETTRADREKARADREERRAEHEKSRADYNAQTLERALAQRHGIQTTAMNLSPVASSDNKFPLSSSRLTLSTNNAQSTEPATTAAKLVSGCGGCGENGDCPCVDSYLEPAPPAQPDSLTESQLLPFSINSLPSPHTTIPTESLGRISSIPELVSDHSSPEDMEIDFTHAYKAQARSIPKADRCGYCEEGGKCICAEAEAAISMSFGGDPVMPPPRTSKPGTCAQCQMNPEQKAYCESLAQARTASREPPTDLPAAKRPRRDQIDIQVPCAEAYAIYKKYSTTKEEPSADQVYQDYVQSNVMKSRENTNARSGQEPLPRQFSAYETDMAAVIATLHHQGAYSQNGRDRTGPQNRTLDRAFAVRPMMQQQELPVTFVHPSCRSNNLDAALAYGVPSSSQCELLMSCHPSYQNRPEVDGADEDVMSSPCSNTTWSSLQTGE